jgi:hypothetical protein
MKFIVTIFQDEDRAFIAERPSPAALVKGRPKKRLRETLNKRSENAWKFAPSAECL